MAGNGEGPSAHESGPSRKHWRIGDEWAANFLVYERAVCLLGAIGLAVVSEVIIGSRHLDAYLCANRYTVFSALAAVFGALLGLVIASSALVLDRLAEGRLHLVQQSRHIHTIPAIFKSAMLALGAATLLSVLALIPTSSATADRIVIYTWALYVLLVVARLARVIWLVSKLMEIVATQESP